MVIRKYYEKEWDYPDSKKTWSQAPLAKRYKHLCRSLTYRGQQSETVEPVLEKMTTTLEGKDNKPQEQETSTCKRKSAREKKERFQFGPEAVFVENITVDVRRPQASMETPGGSKEMVIRDAGSYGCISVPQESSSQLSKGDVQLSEMGGSLSERALGEKAKKRKINIETEDKVSSKEPRKSERLPDFLLRLLRDRDHYGSIISWQEGEEGFFRVCDSNALAAMWGEQRGNPKMNFEKLSRAMREYYKQDILKSDIRKLVYRFTVDDQGQIKWRGSITPKLRGKKVKMRTVAGVTSTDWAQQGTSKEQQTLPSIAGMFPQATKPTIEPQKPFL